HQLVVWQSVHHIGCFQPAAPGRQNSIRHVRAQTLGVMRIGRNDESRTQGSCGSSERAAEVEPLRAAIDLEKYVAEHCFGRDRLKVERVGLTLQNHPARGMAEGIEVRR